MLGELILKHADNLSSMLQYKHISAAEGQQIALMTVQTKLSQFALMRCLISSGQRLPKEQLPWALMIHNCPVVGNEQEGMMMVTQ